MSQAFTSARGGGIRLFRLFGIDVSLHWMWLLVAVYEIQFRVRGYSTVAWSVAEYVTLFLIVLMHEFGHALACRSVGGEADRILLWPLGGVAYVRPPQRPAAVLWSIVAGPLVNVALIPVFAFLVRAAANQALGIHVSPDLYRFLRTVRLINWALLIFNLLPIYPLDGGKILWALLWFVLGQARALMVACLLGIAGTIGAVGLLFAFRSPNADTESWVWLLVLGAFALMQSWNGLAYARRLAKALALPRNTAYVCPSCRQSPPLNVGWKCRQCDQVYDLFAAAATCPQCGLRVDPVPCPLCGAARPLNEWIGQAPLSPPGFQPVPVAPARQ